MQKVKPTTIEDLLAAFDHPSSALFRAIELRQIYEGCKDLEFQTPSVDIGSGDGKIASILFDNKFTYGVDNGEANDYQIAIDNNRYEKVLLESAEKMSLEDNSVNFVFSNSVLEHIPGIEDVFNETARILKPGGYFVFTTPTRFFKAYVKLADILNKIGLGVINQKYSYYRNRSLNHYNLNDHEIYKKMLEKRGLKVCNYSYAISQEVIRKWDRMALIIKLFKVFGVNLERWMTNNQVPSIRAEYKNDQINKQEGANLLIIAQRSYE